MTPTNENAPTPIDTTGVNQDSRHDLQDGIDSSDRGMAIDRNPKSKESLERQSNESDTEPTPTPYSTYMPPRDNLPYSNLITPREEGVADKVEVGDSSGSLSRPIDLMSEGKQRFE